MVTETAHERRLRLVETHARNGLALLTLYDGWRYFEPPEIEGFIAYELHRGVAVACGDPVCAPADLQSMLLAFAQYCESRAWRFTFVGSSAEVGAAAAGLGFKAVKVGEEAFFDLSKRSLTGRAAKKARSAINLGRRTGIVVEEYRDRSPAIDSEIEEVAAEWLATRNGPAMSFLLRSRPLLERERKRIFTATYEGRLVAFLTCSPAPGRDMLFVEELARRQDAPYGTSELLIHVARETARRDGISLFSLGVAPLQGATHQPYGRFHLLRALFALCYGRINFIYSFRSLNHYKKKFGPTFWEDSFLLYQSGLLATALAVLAAFSPDGGIPSLVLPKRLQWLRFVPAVVLWTAAVAGVFVTGFAAWTFPVLQEPVRIPIHALLLVRLPADLAFDLTMAAVLAHRVVTLIVVLALAAVVWRRRVRA